jgi:hypothetical protein
MKSSPPQIKGLLIFAMQPITRMCKHISWSGHAPSRLPIAEQPKGCFSGEARFALHLKDAECNGACWVSQKPKLRASLRFRHHPPLHSFGSLRYLIYCGATFILNKRGCRGRPGGARATSFDETIAIYTFLAFRKA